MHATHHVRFLALRLRASLFLSLLGVFILFAKCTSYAATRTTQGPMGFNGRWSNGMQNNLLATQPST